MPKFSYRACTEQGEIVHGVLESSSLESVEEKIRQEGYTPLKVREKNAFWDQWLGQAQLHHVGRVKVDDLILWTRQLRSLLIAGIPILRTLEVLSQQTESKGLRKVIQKIVYEIEGGSELSTALEKFPHIFPEIYISTIRAGELGGVLPEVLDRLSQYLEYENKVKREIKSALRYPAFVLCGLVMVSMLFTLFVIPRFAAVFKSFKIQLPLPTRFVFASATFLKVHIGLLFIFLAFIIMGFRVYIQTEKGRMRWDHLKLKLPIFGTIFHKTALFRFAWMMKMMYQSGLPLVKALRVVGRTLENQAMEKEVQLASKRVEEGETLSSFLQESPLFPPMVVYMVATGEKSGTLDQMLEEISRHYDMEINYKIRNMTALIEPVVTIFLGVGVLILALSVFLPIWDLMKIARGH